MKRALFGAAMALVLTLGTSAASLAESKDSCGPKMCKKCITLCTNKLAYFKKKGGKYVEAGRIQLMNDCIAACKKRQKDASADTAKACADVCKKCAASCEELNDPSLKECINTCKSCAETCSNTGKKASAASSNKMACCE